MELKRKMAVEVPPKIRSFINYVIAAPLESIGEPLKSFVWDFDKGDFHQWVDLFNHFDFFYEKYIKSRKDLQVEDDFLGSDPPFPKDAVLQILRVIKIILENCTNKHIYSSYEQHLSSLLASTDADVVEASLQTLAAFLKKTTGKYVVRASGLHAKLFAFAQGWGAKEEGLGLVACAIQHRSDQVAYELGSTLHFEFYADDNSKELPASEQLAKGLQVIDLPNINAYKVSDIELFHKLVTDYKVPPTLRFSLFTRLRFARAFNSIASRQQYTCIRLYAFMAFVSYGDYNDLASFCEAQPEFINELVTLLSYEDAVPENIQILSLLSLVVLCQGCTCTHQSTVLAAVTSGGLRGTLSSLMQKAIGSVSSSSKWSIMFAEALLSLVTVLVYSSSSRSAMLDAGFIPILLPLLKDSNPQHLHLVSMAVHILEAILGYSNPAATLFRDLGGLNDAISRLKIELCDVEDVMDQQGTSVVSESSACITEFVTATYSELDSEHPLYSETVVASHRRSLLTALLRAISLVTCAPRSSSRYGPEERLLLHCLSIIFKKTKKFGGGLFSLGATVMSKCIRKDPTCFSILEAAGLPSAFLDAVMDGVLCSAEAVTCIPLCLDALCLSSNGLRAVRDCNALRCFVEIFTSRMYLPVLTGLTVESLSIGLDELMHHASSLRVPGVEMLIDIFNSIAKLGSRTEVSFSSSDSPGCSTPYPVKTGLEEQNVIQLEDGKLCKTDNSDKLRELTFDILLMDVEVFLPEYITNATRLLETILQNSETCCIFIEKKGIKAVLQLFMLPHMPLWASVGRRISAAFKNLFPKHPVSLVQAVCSFLREHLQLTNDILSSTSGAHLDQLESVTLMKLLRCLSGLNGILSVCISLLKGTAMLISELATSDAVVLIELGRVYRDINWQISLCSDIKVDEKPNVTAESVNVDAALINTAGRESDDDVNIPVVRNNNPASVRNNLHPQQGLGHNFLSLLSSGEGFSRLSRHGLARICGGRTNRHSETLQIDSVVSADSIALPSSQNMKKKRPEVLSHEILNKLSSTLRCFFIALVKGFTLPNHRRSDTGSIAAASKSIGTALAKVFLEALGFSKCSTFDELSVSGKCRYLGNVVDDMIGLVYDSRRRTSYTAMINNFYIYGTFKELLTTFEATSQLLWTQPYALPISAIGHKTVAEGSKLAHNSWLRDTLKRYCSVLEYFVNSALLLCPTSVSQTQMLVQPVAVGLSMGLFPVPKDPEVFVRILQSQVLDVILPVWNHPMFPNCSPAFISSVVSLVTHIYSGVGDVKRNHIDMSGSTIQRSLVPPPDETTISTIVEMGFTRARAEEAIPPPLDDILMSAMKLLETSDSMAFPLTDLLVTICSRNKGEDRARVTSYLTQQLKICPLQIVKYPTALCMVSHTLALLLNGDGNMRDIVVRDGIVSFAIDILMKFKASTEPGNVLVVPKCISALLLILDNLSQSTPRIPTERTDANSAGSSPESNNEHPPMERKSAPKEVTEKQSPPDALERGINTTIENIFGKSTGYLTFEESSRLLMIACDLIKLHVPPLVMQAILHLCARLTKTHTLALQFLEVGGLFALFSIPKSCFFPGYDTVTSAIIRHLIEDPQTLRTAMELEIRQKLRNHRAGRVPVRAFLKSMAPVISRDPAIFMKAAASICHLESFRGRTVVFISKEKEKERQKAEVKVEPRALSNDCVQIRESKINVAGKGATGHKKIPANVTQVIDQLLQVLSSYPAPKSEEKYVSYPGAMDIDEPLTKMKGKSKVDETRKNEPDNTSEKSTGMVKVTFVLKLLTDILEIYVHAVGVILKRDVEMCQLREPNLLDCPGHGGILSHVLNHLVISSVDRTSGPGKWREKLSQKASWFLVILCGQSSEGRRRVITEIVKALTSLSNLESSSSRDSLCPDKKVLSFVNLVYIILLKNSSSSDLSCTGCSSNIAKSMINGGIVQCLSCILQVMDLDHPDASKVVNCILRSLEILTTAANAGEQLSKSETFQKKTLVGPGQSSDNQADATLVTQTLEYDQNRSQHEVNSIGNTDQEPEGRAQEGNDLHSIVPNHLLEQDIRGEAEEIVTSNTTVDLGIDFMRDEMEDGDMISNPDSVETTFHVENRGDYDMGEQDDDMGHDGEEVDDDEEEDITEDGTILMSLADTDVDDHDEADLEDDYSDDTVDEDDDDDDFYESLFEVRWREAFDGLNDDDDDNDLFGLRGPIGFDHRRQTSRNLFDRSITEGNCFQHPLFSRPSQFSDLPLTRSSGGNSSRDLGSLSAGSIDGAHLYMCDALTGPYDNVPTVEFGERLAASSADFSVGLESLHVPGRRAPGAGRWTDDGYPQINGQSAVVAQAVEKQFICQLRGNASSNNPPGIQSHVSESQERHFDGPLISDSQIAVQVDNIEAQQCEDQHCESGHGTVNNHIGESIAVGLEAGGEVIHNNSSNGHVNMEIGEGNDIISQQGGATTQGTQQFEMTFEVPPSHHDLSSEAMNNDTSSTIDCHTNINTSNISVVEMPNPGVAQQAEGQVEMDNASVIATFPSDMREGVPLTSSELAILSAPSPLVAEAQMLRDRAMSHSQAHSLSGNNRRYSHRRNGLAIDRQTLMGRGVGVTIGQKASSFAESMKLKEVEGKLLLDTNALKALIRLLRLAQPLGKGVLQRLLSNLCAHSCTRAILVRYLIDMINPGTENSYEFTSRRLYGCQSNVVYSRSQLLHGVPPLVMLQVLEVMIYLANSHSAVANILFYLDPSLVRDSLSPKSLELKTDKGKEKTVENRDLTTLTESLMETDIPLVFLLKLLRQPLFLRSNAHMERVLVLIKIVVSSAAIKLVCESHPEPGAASIFKKLYGNEQVRDIQNDSLVLERESDVSGNSKKLSVLEAESAGLSTPDGQKICMHDIFLQLPECDLHNLCSLLGNEGLSDKVYLLAGEVMRKLAEVVAPHRKFFILQLSDLAHSLSSSAVNELVTLRNTRVLCLSAGSITGAAMLRVLQTLGSLASPNIEGIQAVERVDEHEEHAILLNLNISLGPLWQELSNCISTTEMHLAQCSPNLIMSDTNVGEHVRGSSSQTPLPPGTQRLLPFIEAFLVLCEKLQAKNSIIQQDHANETAREVKEFSGSSASFSANSETDSLRRVDGAITFMRFAEKHRRLLNAFIRQNPGLLEKTLAVILKLPRLIDFDNKRAYFRSRIRKQHEPLLYVPLPISVRRAYILEDSYNQLRKIPTHFLKARLIVHFQGEEGVDAGGLTREWYQLLSRAIFDKGALLFTTGGDNATFQPNPNSVYQTEHLSYFKFVGRVIAKALYDGQLLDVYFTRSFYKHILGIKVTYHDIEAVDPDYYKNLKWMLVNNVSEIPDLTFSMDVDEEKHILNGKAEVTEYELKPGGGNIRVTEETKHEYVDLVAEHILTNAIRPQINSFLEGFTELIPRELISIFNDKELELLISGLPEIDLDDLKANTEYTGYTVASNVVQWFWEVIKTFNKEDTARFLQFVTGTSKVPLEGFKALQGNSGPQKFNICKAYGGPERLPSAHTCFNQLDLPQYISNEQLQERLLLAIHEASEGFGFK